MAILRELPSFKFWGKHKIPVENVGATQWKEQQWTLDMLLGKNKEVKDNMTLPKTLDYQTTLKPQSFRSTTNIRCRNDNNKCL
jgi:hypothetical protein